MEGDTTAVPEKGIKMWLVREIAGLIFSGLALFLPAWTLNWFEGWLFMGVLVIIKVLGDAWIYKSQPGLLIKRASHSRQSTKTWDKVLAPLVALSSLGISVVAGFDKRLGWSSFEQSWVIWVGLGFLVLSSVLIFWAMRSNAFFDGTVNIQEDHQVAGQGPYQFVRHPGYLGIFFMCLCIPLALDSMVAYIPAVFFVLVLFLRTWLEDRTLKKELPGYAGYAQKVKFRLFPNIW